MSGDLVIRTLLVEENTFHGRLISALLAAAEFDTFQVVQAHSLAEAVDELVIDDHCDAVLLSLSLPDSEGIDTLTDFHSRFPGIPIIALTEYANYQLGVDAVQHGAQDFLIKSEVDARMLERAIRHAIERHAIEAQLRAFNQELEKRVADRTAELQEYVSRLEKEVEERKRIETLKDAFVDTVSHELRTPVAIVREGIGLINDGILGDVTEKQQHYLSLASRNLDRLARTINNLLDISQIESGKMTLCRRETELVQLVGEIHSTFKPRADRIGVEFRIDVPRAPVVANVDPDAVVQILTNLVGNAMKFTSEGFVSISLKKKGEMVVLEVADSGCGIESADMEKLFEKFQRGNSLVRRGERGSGLGLAITKSLIELHGGAIKVDSAPGKGTMFRIELPIDDELEGENNGKRKNFDH
jgi:signal transduction histidine kinase